MFEIKLRPCERQAFCRGCDCVIEKGENMITTFSFRNKGQHIHFCIFCADIIGELASQAIKDSQYAKTQD